LQGESEGTLTTSGRKKAPLTLLNTDASWLGGIINKNNEVNPKPFIMNPN